MITINDLKKEMETICGKWESMGVNPNESLYEFLRFVQPEPFDYDYDSDHYDNRDEIAVEKRILQRKG